MIVAVHCLCLPNLPFPAETGFSRRPTVRKLALILTVILMLIWNYIVTPIYYQMPREAVVALMIPGLLPFNLIKYGMNAGITLVMYKPIVNVLRRFKMVDGGSGKKDAQKGMVLLGLFVVLTLVCVIMAMQGLI